MQPSGMFFEFAPNCLLMIFTRLSTSLHFLSSVKLSTILTVSDLIISWKIAKHFSTINSHFRQSLSGFKKCSTASFRHTSFQIKHSVVSVNHSECKRSPNWAGRPIRPTCGWFPTELNVIFIIFATSSYFSALYSSSTLLNDVTLSKY